MVVHADKLKTCYSDTPTPELRPKSAADAAPDELWKYKIPLRRHRTPLPSSSSSSGELTSGQSRKSRSLHGRRGRADSFESVMPKLTREAFVAPSPRKGLIEKKCGKQSQVHHTRMQKRRNKHKERSESGHGDEDIRRALRQLTREVRLADLFVQMNRPIPVEILCSPGLGAVSRTGVVLEDTVMEDVGTEVRRQTQSEEEKSSWCVRNSIDFSELRPLGREGTCS